MVAISDCPLFLIYKMLLLLKMIKIMGALFYLMLFFYYFLTEICHLIFFSWIIHQTFIQFICKLFHKIWFYFHFSYHQHRKLASQKFNLVLSVFTSWTSQFFLFHSITIFCIFSVCLFNLLFCFINCPLIKALLPS